MKNNILAAPEGETVEETQVCSDSGAAGGHLPPSLRSPALTECSRPGAGGRCPSKGLGAPAAPCV